MTAPVIVTPNWELPFEMMHGVRDYVVGAVLGQHHEKIFHAIYYTSKVLNENRVSYTTTGFSGISNWFESGWFYSSFGIEIHIQ